MSWLRLDDGFAQHPKVTALTDRQFRAWIKTLCLCARYRTAGVISAGTRKEAGLRNSDLTDFAALGLVETREETVVVHDWRFYNGTTAEKVEAYLTDHPEASANEVYRAIGGKREVVLAAVARYLGNQENGSLNGSESGSRARGPVPNPKSKTKPIAAAPPRRREPDIEFEALLDVCELELGELTLTSRKAANRALREIREAGGDANAIRVRATVYRSRFDMPLTPMALAKHWPALNASHAELTPEQRRERHVEQLRAEGRMQ